MIPPSSLLGTQTVGAGKGCGPEGPWDSVCEYMCLSLVKGLENAVSFWQACMRFFLRNPWKAHFSLVTPCLQVRDIVIKNL